MFFNVVCISWKLKCWTVVYCVRHHWYYMITLFILLKLGHTKNKENFSRVLEIEDFRSQLQKKIFLFSFQSLHTSPYLNLRHRWSFLFFEGLPWLCQLCDIFHKSFGNRIWWHCCTSCFYLWCYFSFLWIILLHHISDAVPQPVSAADLYFTSTLYNSRSINFSYAVGGHKLGFCAYSNDQCSSTGRESVDATCDCLTNRLVNRQCY